MDRQDYNTKAQSLLDDKDTYRPLPEDPTAKLKSQLINILKNCQAQGQGNKATYKRLLPHLCHPIQVLWCTQNPQAKHSPLAHRVQ